MTTTVDTPPNMVLADFELDPDSLEPIAGGLINRSFLARRAGQRVVLQRVSEIFGRRLNDDLAAVTAHLAAKGLLTPRLIATRDGGLTCEHKSGRWRLWTYVDGVTVHALESANQARAAGRLVADFHRALLDFEHEFESPRLGVHDTPAHMQRLRQALVAHAKHRAYPRVEPLAREILALNETLPAVPGTPDRVVHGDLKISNVLFDPQTSTARCLIDLDTVARMPLPLELGDAMRSWCNPLGEDDPDSRFELAYFEAAMTGYADGSGSFIIKDEWRAILPATLMITVELAARFCADALNESYFGWDRVRFSSASAHNQARTRGQLALAASLKDQYPQAGAILEAIFGG